LSEPLVSVIIPAYNRAKLIGKAIDSVLNQSYKNFVIIVVDDGSSDNTREICETYINAHPEKIIYYYKANGGCASARNYGLYKIDDNVKYICFLDSDDCFLPDKLKTETDLLEKYPDADYCYANAIIYIEELDQTLIHHVAATEHPEVFAIEHFLTNDAKPGAILYRAKILRDKRFDETLLHNEDSEFLQRIAIEHKGVYSHEPSCWVMDHAGSKSRNRVAICKSVLHANQKILEMYPDFYDTYRPHVEPRMLQVRNDVFVELMIAKNCNEAEMYAQNSIEKLFAYLRLGIFYKIRRFLWRQFVSKFTVLKRITEK
jgi:glycosyltransferase involved in cell wall biosynthesis